MFRVTAKKVNANAVYTKHQMLNKQIIDKSFSFYSLDEKYKDKAYKCMQEILGNDSYRQKFLEVYKTLYVLDSNQFREYWKIKDMELLFGSGVNPFAANLMILVGMPIHQAKMKDMGFDNNQITCHKTRVKECFINDLEKRGYKGVRVSQMLWASYFISCRIIEVGLLQYEYDSSIDKIKIHIPRIPKLDMNKVKKSLFAAKAEIKKYFHFTDQQYVCNSWLLSKQLSPILNDNSNIKQFQTLFSIKDGNDCIDDILNYVYGLKSCDDYKELPEDTFLQKQIKLELLKGTIFKLGCGEII